MLARLMDAPSLAGALTRWTVSAVTGEIQLSAHQHAQARGGTPALCLGLAGGANVSVQKCGSASTATFAEATGQLVFGHSEFGGGDGGSLCVQAVQREQSAATVPTLVAKPCTQPKVKRVFALGPRVQKIPVTRRTPPHAGPPR